MNFGGERQARVGGQLRTERERERQCVGRDELIAEQVRKSLIVSAGAGDPKMDNFPRFPVLSFALLLDYVICFFCQAAAPGKFPCVWCVSQEEPPNWSV